MYLNSGVTAQKEMRGQCIRLNGDAPSMENVLDRRTTELEPSPDDVILPSQDDVFCLHMSQSQSSVVASQPRSQPDGKIATFNAEPRDVMHWERNVENAVSLLGNKGNVPNAITSPTTGDDLIDNLTSRVNERNLGNIETSPTTNENMTPKPNERDKVNTIPSLTNMETLNDIKTSTDNEDNRLNNVTCRNKKIAGGNVTPPYSRLSDTILVQTPLGHPSNTVHHRDIPETDTDEGDYSIVRFLCTPYFGYCKSRQVYSVKVSSIRLVLEMHEKYCNSDLPPLNYYILTIPLLDMTVLNHPTHL